MLYPLKGSLGQVESFGPGTVEVKVSYGGFTLPIRRGAEPGVLLARRDLKEGIPYPGWFNCLGGGASEKEGSPAMVVGREFQEESLCELGNVVGRVGRPLQAVLGFPKQAGDPIVVDTAEAFLVEFDGMPKVTDESREYRWFSFDDLRREDKIVGKDRTPIGRTMQFALWGASLAREPVFRGAVTVSELRELFPENRLVPCTDFQLVNQDRFLVCVSRLSTRDMWVDVWNNLSLDESADENGVLPGPTLFV